MLASPPIMRLPNHLVGRVTLPLHREPPGYLVPQRLSLGLHQVVQGRSYRIDRSRRLRHPLEAHRTVGDLLDLINTDSHVADEPHGRLARPIR